MQTRFALFAETDIVFAFLYYYVLHSSKKCSIFAVAFGKVVALMLHGGIKEKESNKSGIAANQ